MNQVALINILVFSILIFIVFWLFVFLNLRQKKRQKVVHYQRKLLVKDLIKKDLQPRWGLEHGEIANLTLTRNKLKTQPNTEFYVCLFELSPTHKNPQFQKMAVEVIGKRTSSKNSEPVSSWKLGEQLEVEQAQLLVQLNDRKVFKTPTQKKLAKELKTQLNQEKITVLKNPPSPVESNPKTSDDFEIKKFVPHRNRRSVN